MTQNILIDDIAKYVFDLMNDQLSDDCVYHNFRHTEQTAEACIELTENIELEQTEKEDIIIAAWFHDIGYIKDYKNHEEESVIIAREYLKNKLPEDRIKNIEGLILSTKVNTELKTLSEEILHDADYINIGKKSFPQRAELLRVEWENLMKKEFNDVEWAQQQLDFLIRKKYKTIYAIRKYGERRDKNIKKQRERIEKSKTDLYKQHLKEESVKVKAQKEGRGIETLYRSVYDYHINLSSIADTKANIMISINTIIVSIIITLFGSGYTFTGSGTFTSVRFVFPMSFLVISSVLSVVFAILSARPNITTKEKFELKNKNSSILFFGNFAQLQISDFVNHIRELKNEKEDLYESMTVDIYHLGAVLVRKYKLLTWSYNIFMGGFVLCALGFLVIMLFSY